MAIGIGGMMAEVMGGINVADLRGKWIPCPICGGPMAVGSMTRQMKCQSDRGEDMPDWLATALKAAGFDPWAFYQHDNAIDVLAEAANGAQLWPMRDRGRFGGWQWEGVPEGEITWTITVDHESREAYIRERMEAWVAELESLLSHPDVAFSETDLEAGHPRDLVRRAKGQIEAAEAARQKVAEREAQRVRYQEKLDRALREDGFFYGRVGRAEIDQSVCVIVWQTSSGDKNDPNRLIAATSPGSLTVSKLVALVKARGDMDSQVATKGDRVAILTSSPGQWMAETGRSSTPLAVGWGGGSRWSTKPKGNDTPELDLKLKSVLNHTCGSSGM